jgi:hypothetical protein
MYPGYHGGGREFNANNAMDRYCRDCEYAWKGSDHKCFFCGKYGVPKPSGGPVIQHGMTIRQKDYEAEGAS